MDEHLDDHPDDRADDYSWGPLALAGLSPDFHADPAVDGVPLPSADGHWWWTGLRWTPVRVPDAPQPAPRMAGAGWR